MELALQLVGGPHHLRRVAGGARLDDGSAFDGTRYRSIRDEEVAKLGAGAYGHLAEAATLLDGLVLDDDFAEFLTLRAYPLLG